MSQPNFDLTVVSKVVSFGGAPNDDHAAVIQAVEEYLSGGGTADLDKVLYCCELIDAPGPALRYIAQVLDNRASSTEMVMTCLYCMSWLIPTHRYLLATVVCYCWHADPGVATRAVECLRFATASEAGRFPGLPRLLADLLASSHNPDLLNEAFDALLAIDEGSSIPASTLRALTTSSPLRFAHRTRAEQLLASAGVH